MDGLSLAANIIAVVELSAKIASLCVEYSKAVKNAKSDIKRLQNELGSLDVVLLEARKLLDGPGGARLQTAVQLQGALDDACSDLRKLIMKMEEKLNVGNPRKAMSRFGIRAIKWPFESKDVDNIIRNLDRHRSTLSAALIVDNTALHISTYSHVQRIRQAVNISRLPVAIDAAFDSHSNEDDARCHPGTRVELRQAISAWAAEADTETIFWLNGMAGTGKSTISRTMAESFAEEGCLAASFFFKRGERDRGNASRLFTTIATQLSHRIPHLALLLNKAIDYDPSIPHKSVGEQFNNLILNPLREMDSSQTNVRMLVIVIDALDECDKLDEVKRIVQLLSLLKPLTSIKLKAFVTSRPELPIRLGFRSIQGKYRDLLLHEIPKPVIEHDIFEFLHGRLGQIRSDYNSQVPPESQLSTVWPGKETVDSLVQMATPLFIFAATICRFIQDPLSDPKSQLEHILEYGFMAEQSEVEKLGATYRPSLDQLLVGRSEKAKRTFLVNFRAIVGTIVLLAEPLSIPSLSLLLGVAGRVIDGMLRSFHSVLSVPASSQLPVRMFHLSFRDFLIDSSKRDANPFWVDEKETNERLANRCLELLLYSGHLKQDICELKRPGTPRATILQTVIDSKLPDEVRYACLYWPHHLKESGVQITDSHQAYDFLRGNFLFWLEALSILGRAVESTTMVNTLQSIVCPNNGAEASRFLHDAGRFALTYASIVDRYPLQLYTSAIAFAPKTSIVRRLSEKCMPEWIQQPPIPRGAWDACLCVMEQGNDRELHFDRIFFSPDGKDLITASIDGNVQRWNPKTGELIQTIQAKWDIIVPENEAMQARGQLYELGVFCISPSGNLFAWTINDTIIVWDPSTGERRQIFGRYKAACLEFSRDAKLLACGLEDGTVLVFDVPNSRLTHKFQGHQPNATVTMVSFSWDGESLASRAEDATLGTYNLISNQQLNRFKADGLRGRVLFSPDSMLLAVTTGISFRIYHARNCEELHVLEGHFFEVVAIAFSRDGLRIASTDTDTVRLWDVTTATELRAFDISRLADRSLAFSPDGNTIATVSTNGTVRLWDSGPSAEGVKWHDEKHGGAVEMVTLSQDGQRVASLGADGRIGIWDSKTGRNTAMLSRSHQKPFRHIVFSPANKDILASIERQGGGAMARVWDLVSERQIQELPPCIQDSSNSFSVLMLAFSPSGETLASLHNGVAELWDTLSWKRLHAIRDNDMRFETVAFSADNKLLALGCGSGGIVLWDLNMGKWKQKFDVADDDSCDFMAFSPDGYVLASTTFKGYIEFWDVISGACFGMVDIRARRTESIAFNACGSRLVTDFGEVDVPPRAGSGQPPGEPMFPLTTRGYGLSQDEHWLCWESEKLLWLPPDYRPQSSLIRGQQVVLGLPSGRVCIFEFAEEPVERKRRGNVQLDPSAATFHP
ncbi:hypothetical protein B0T10DRAFT_431737 [Thelonectria olida]|uniref:Mitochondrial division protein 1 n=1 Tax=Thelonectria olida TaxID=1576542 RepID=A0A9P9AXI4_9HYPO|nr:hypothetical protein B0T10DRAFT_431737 [Thelonectria olida]